MRNPYEIIDEFCINRAEWFSAKIQGWFGITNFAIAKFIAKFATIFPSIFMLIKWKDDGLTRILLFSPILIGAAIIHYYIFSEEIIQFDEKKVIDEAKKGLGNNLKLQLFHTRGYFFIAGTLIFTWNIARSDIDFFAPMLMMFWVAHIFLACTPLPPSESKVRQWLNGLKAWSASPAGANSLAFRSPNEAPFFI